MSAIEGIHDLSIDTSICTVLVPINNDVKREVYENNFLQGFNLFYLIFAIYEFEARYYLIYKNFWSF